MPRENRKEKEFDIYNFEGMSHTKNTSRREEVRTKDGG